MSEQAKVDPKIPDAEILIQSSMILSIGDNDHCWCGNGSTHPHRRFLRNSSTPSGDRIKVGRNEKSTQSGWSSLVLVVESLFTVCNCISSKGLQFRGRSGVGGLNFVSIPFVLVLIDEDDCGKCTVKTRG